MICDIPIPKRIQNTQLYGIHMWHDQEEWVGCRRCCFWDIWEKQCSNLLVLYCFEHCQILQLCNHIPNRNGFASKWNILKLCEKIDSFPLIMSHMWCMYETFLKSMWNRPTCNVEQKWSLLVTMYVKNLMWYSCGTNVIRMYTFFITKLAEITRLIAKSNTLRVRVNVRRTTS